MKYTYNYQQSCSNKPDGLVQIPKKNIENHENKTKPLTMASSPLKEPVTKKKKLTVTDLS